MKSTQLAEYPRLKSVLSPTYYDELYTYSEQHAKEFRNTFINFYSVFVDLTITQGKTGYAALNIISNSTTLERHYRLLIGFIWSKYLTFSYGSKHNYSNITFQILNQLANNNNLTLTKVNASTKSINASVQKCLDEFYALDLSQNILEYYQGWTVNSKEGRELNLHLARFYDTYGKKFTDKCFNAISNYILTQKANTAETLIIGLTTLLNAFTRVYPSKESLEENLQASRSHHLFELVMNLLFAESQAKGHDPKFFFRFWKNSVKTYSECFINTGVFDEPLKPFLTPEFKVPKDSTLTFSIGGKLTPKETERWLVVIPLHIKDEEAIEIIKQRLERDLTHIRTIAHKIFEEIKQRLDRNEKHKSEGTIKPKGDGTNSVNFGFKIGFNHLKNTIATFNYHGFTHTPNYAKFLGFDSTSELTKELCLPTPSTINALISLLILEHPLITPSWLQKWELFDKSGTQVGFKQSSNQWIAVSYKDRRGARNSQQEVILNDYSKSIVETLIEHTQFARESLKAKGDTNWRYMLLTATLTGARYRHGLVKSMSVRNQFQEALSIATYQSSGEVLLDQAEAEALSQLVTLKAIRKAVGLQVYLETNSLHAVAEALGHKKVRLELLGSYLPKPLMEYFNARWVRQFQNAIVFEAMKDSLYLFDALDFSHDELSEFLENHGIKKLPENLGRSFGFKAENTTSSSDNNHIDEITFTLSTALLQVIIAIKTVIESADKEDAFKDIVTVWYESAVFILTSLNLESKSHVDILPLLEKAKSNPLNIDRFKENLLCR